jgi:maltose alpha-D-glucosyltransferase/alpha-amylase
VNQHLWYALASGDARPLAAALRDTRRIPDTCQWAHFLRNHDELDLERLSPAERDEVMAAFAPEPEMRAFGRGIRRRLAPMLGDLRRTLLAHAIVESLPGAPVIRYGEEIGMGEDLSLPDRAAVRTPMQWSAQPNGGFSKAPTEIVRPAVIDQGPYAYSRVNVADQELRPDSQLSKVAQLARTRRQLGDCPSSHCEALSLRQRAVFGVVHHRPGDSVVMLANLCPDELEVELPYEVRSDLLADSDYEPATGTSVRLAGHGYRWLRVHDDTR